MGKKVVVIGAGFAGHTAALYLGKTLGRDHEITVVNRHDKFIFIPSLVWAGIDRMQLDKLQFPLRPVYDRFHVNFLHGAARSIHVDENFLRADSANGGGQQRLDYDYLLVATGPHLNFEATPGLGPKEGNSLSICTPPHAIESRDRYLEAVARMEKGERQRFVIGTGHGTSTCQGAAFEYISNIHKDLLHRGLRDKADIKWLSNEAALGDFGVAGVTVAKGKSLQTSEEFIRMVFDDMSVESQVQSAVKAVEPGKAHWENYEGEEGTEPFDFGMLIPAFKAVKLDYIDKDGKDVSDQYCNPGGFLKVDGIYGQSYDDLVDNPDSWPATYRSPLKSNLFAAGIAFAPPGPISRPHTNPKGTVISAAPPRTGMVSGITGRLVAKNIIAEIENSGRQHAERMTEMYAACIASMGNSLVDGSAAVILIHPVVPNFKKYPSTGRDVFVSSMEMGLAGAWMKRMIHSTFMWKLQGRPGWNLIPE